MESSCSQVSTESSLDLAFAFNNAKFSDRTLNLQIMNHSTVSKTEDQDSNVVQSNENRSSTDFPVTQVKTINISTVVLAARSQFFYKLFSNGMSESNERHISLQIQDSEEVAFWDMLKFMYTNTLLSTTHSALVDVLVVADKYEVASCMIYCFQLLSKLPMTCESASLYLNLPSTILMNDTVRPLTDAAKDFLVACFEEISKFEEELLTLPLVGIEAVLLRDDLQVNSEDCVYDFVMKWARKRFTSLDERREILTTRLIPLIRFPFMSCCKLEEVVTCTDINLEVLPKIVFHALSFRLSHQQLPCVAAERAYKERPVKVIRFDSPREVCKVYLGLKHDECARLLPDDEINSETFDLAGNKFHLRCTHKITENTHKFGFYLRMLEEGLIDVEFELSARKKQCEKFVVKRKIEYSFTTRHAYGCYLFNEPWDKFIAEDSPYFINGVLHLRAVIKIKKDGSIIMQSSK